MKTVKNGIIKFILALLIAAGCIYIGIEALPTIKLGLDLNGGVSITYQSVTPNPTQEQMSDAIYKLQLKAQDYSTEAEVYQEGNDKIDIDIPGVSDANKILEELGEPGNLYFVEGNLTWPIATASVASPSVATSSNANVSTSSNIASSILGGNVNIEGANVIQNPDGSITIGGDASNGGTVLQSGNATNSNVQYDYDAPLTVPKQKEKGITITPPTLIDPPVVIDKTWDAATSDELKTTDETVVGKEGMRVDREMFRSFQEDIISDTDLVKMYDDGNIDGVWNYLKDKVFDKPKYYMSPEKIRKIFNFDRRLDMGEIIELILKNKEPATRDEYIKARFDEFVNHNNLGEELVGDKYNNAFELFDAYITNPRVSDAIDNKNYSLLAGFGSVSLEQLKDLGVDLMNQIINYIRDYINIDKLRVKD